LIVVAASSMAHTRQRTLPLYQGNVDAEAIPGWLMS
jgi:hypothetical protein